MAPVAIKPPTLVSAPASTAKSMTARIIPKPASAEGAPATVKPTIKKETVRIEVPTARTVPQATVKIQATPTPIKRPEVSASALVPAPMPTLKTVAVEDEETEITTHDPMVMYAAIGVLLFALVNFSVQLLTYLSN